MFKSNISLIKIVWQRSPLWYKILLVVVLILDIPLLFCIFYFSDDPQRSWISNLSITILALFGLIGAARAFYVFVIKKEGPLYGLEHRLFSRPKKSDR